MSDHAMTNAAASPKSPRSRLLLIALIVGTIVAIVAIVPALAMATMSVMVVAAGTNPVIYTFLVFAFGMPVVVVLGPVLAWIAFGLRRERTSWVLLISPAVWACVTVGLLAVAPGGSS